MRTEIIDAFTAHFPNCERGLRHLEDINHFPHITFSIVAESRTHNSANQRFGVLSISMRSYSYGTIEDAETLGDNIESLVESFNPTGIIDCYITSYSTDEGLLLPYAIIDHAINLSYEVN